MEDSKQSKYCYRESTARCSCMAARARGFGPNPKGVYLEEEAHNSAYQISPIHTSHEDEWWADHTKVKLKKTSAKEWRKKITEKETKKTQKMKIQKGILKRMKQRKVDHTSGLESSNKDYSCTQYNHSQ